MVGRKAARKAIFVITQTLAKDRRREESEEAQGVGQHFKTWTRDYKANGMPNKVGR